MGGRDQFPEIPVAAAAERDREYEFTRKDFERVRDLIYTRAGIRLNESKQNMVYSRLSRRLRLLGLGAVREYLDVLEADAGPEWQEFTNALTTNLTAFFREPHHFPELARFLLARDRVSEPRVWCAAASTGEEPWTIAMTLIETLGAQTSGCIYATDIDTAVLEKARRGVYRLEAARVCGDARLRRFFFKGRGANEGLVRVRPELAQRVEFGALNLLADDWLKRSQFAGGVDAVFCRNVMIYFDKPTQREVLRRIARVLRPGGLLFAGHSENFTDCRDQFALRGKTVYERIGT